MSKSFILVLALVAATVPAGAQQAVPAKAGAQPTWQIDPNHSELGFRIRHLTGRVRGGIAIWQGELVADPARLGGGSIDVFAYPGTIDTGNKERDDHLRSGDFFDVVNHPTIRFTSRSVTAKGKQLEIVGDLTIKGITKRVTLTGQYTGMAPKDAAGKPRLGFTASTTINRQDFGLSWNRLVEGMTMVGDEVTVEIALEAVRKG